MPTIYTWRDLPACGELDILPQADGDLVIRVYDQKERNACVYMGWRQALDIAAKLVEAARIAEAAERGLDVKFEGKSPLPADDAA